MRLGADVRHARFNWLLLARAVILAVTVFSTTAYLAGLVYYYQRLLIPDDQLMAGSDLTIRQMHLYMDLIGLPPAVYAWFNVIFMAALGLGYVGVALLLLWYKPKDGMATFTALILVLFGTGFAPVFEFAASSFPNWKPLFNLLVTPGFSLLFILYLTFPDGRFVPRWTAFFGVFWVVENVIADYWPGSPLSMFDYPYPWGILFMVLTLGVFIFAQIYRYYFVSDRVQRQQTRWVVVGLLVAVIALPIPWLLEWLWPEFTSISLLGLLSDTITTVLYVFAFLQIPITIGVAVSRYHLWDIDVLLRRTVLYSLLTISLAVIYLVKVIVLQFLFDRVFQVGDSPLITVISTLFIVVLFHPLRKRIQGGLDGQFYRRKQDSLRALTAFHARTQSDVDIPTLASALQQVVMDSVQPELVTVWIRPGKVSSPHRIVPDVPGGGAVSRNGTAADAIRNDAFRNDYETLDQ